MMSAPDCSSVTAVEISQSTALVVKSPHSCGTPSGERDSFWRHDSSPTVQIMGC